MHALSTAYVSTSIAGDRRGNPPYGRSECHCGAVTSSARDTVTGVSDDLVLRWGPLEPQ